MATGVSWRVGAQAGEERVQASSSEVEKGRGRTRVLSYGPGATGGRGRPLMADGTCEGRPGRGRRWEHACARLRGRPLTRIKCAVTSQTRAHEGDEGAGSTALCRCRRCELALTRGGRRGDAVALRSNGWRSPTSHRPRRVRLVGSAEPTRSSPSLT